MFILLPGSGHFGSIFEENIDGLRSLDSNRVSKNKEPSTVLIFEYRVTNGLPIKN